MIRSTPHPPATPVACADINLGNLNSTNVRPKIKVEDTLVVISEYLTCAAATACESAENSSTEFRPLARAVVHQIEAARILVEASIAELGAAASGAEHHR